jgi:hypothetical protein
MRKARTRDADAILTSLLVPKVVFMVLWTRHSLNFNFEERIKLVGKLSAERQYGRSLILTGNNSRWSCNGSGMVVGGKKLIEKLLSLS